MGSSLAEAGGGGPGRSKPLSAAQLFGKHFPVRTGTGEKVPPFATLQENSSYPTQGWPERSHCNCETRHFLNAMLVTAPHSQHRGSGDE